MLCPHCRVTVHPQPQDIVVGSDKDEAWILRRILCPACERFVLLLVNGPGGYDRGHSLVGLAHERRSFLVRPKTHSRALCPAEVPPDLREDYEEACAVFADSPKASSALSRRCLQHLLRAAAGVKPGDLASEIQQVLDSGKLPTHLAESIDAVRNIGNFAAHPLKSRHSGEVLDVEPGEAEWNLDVLEGLFDFYYVQPAILKRKRSALDKKLGDAGKPPMK